MRTTRLVRLTIIALLFSTFPIAQAEDKFFDSDGVKIHYMEQGDGEPVLLIHGFSANYLVNWSMPGIIKALSEDYRVIALDNRGHGKSDKPHDPEQYGNEMVEDAVRLLDHLKIDKAHIVGYSMGGFITNKLLMENPDRFITATLGGAGWSEDGDPSQSIMLELADSLENGKGIGPLIIALTPPGKPTPTEEEINATNQLIMAMNDPKALAAAIRGMEDMHISQKELQANQVPTLALIGEVDPLKAGVDRLEAVMPNLKVVVIDGADHMSAMNHPKFIGSLKEFIAAHSMAAAATAN